MLLMRLIVLYNLQIGVLILIQLLTVINIQNLFIEFLTREELNLRGKLFFSIANCNKRQIYYCLRILPYSAPSNEFIRYMPMCCIPYPLLSHIFHTSWLNPLLNIIRIILIRTVIHMLLKQLRPFLTLNNLVILIIRTIFILNPLLRFPPYCSFELRPLRVISTTRFVIL